MEKLEKVEFKELTTEEIGMVSGAGLTRHLTAHYTYSTHSTDYGVDFGIDW